MNISAHTGLAPASSTWWDFGEVPNLRPKPLGHRATRQFIGNLTYMYFCLWDTLWIFRCIRDSILRHPWGGIWGRSKIWGQCMLPQSLNHRATWQFIGNLTYIVLLPWGSLWIFQCIWDSIPHRPPGGILGRSQILRLIYVAWTARPLNSAAIASDPYPPPYVPKYLQATAQQKYI